MQQLPNGSNSNDSITNKKTDENEEKIKKKSFEKDKKNIIFLMFLYFLQAIPIGICASLPYILSARKISYAEQGTFSFAFWPFSMKLLWAPIVDTFHFKKYGIRKSWLIPVQYLIGFYMFFSAGYVKQFIEEISSGQGNILLLSAMFFLFTFLAATQDIVVDGWALTILSKENVSWASTCESTGGSIGWFVGNVLFLVLESTEFSNKYLRSPFGFELQDYGLVNIQSFMRFFGIIFILTTTLILMYKKENQDVTNDSSIFESYKLIFQIIKLKPVLKLVFVSFTLRLCFGTESMSFLKTVEAGVPKEKLGILAIPLTPLQILLPFFISRILDGKSPFKYFSIAIFSRATIILIMSILVYITPYFKLADNSYSYTFYTVTILLQAFHSITVYSSFVPVLMFFNRISDKQIGGTYMTLLNTIMNLARSLTNTGTLYLANFLTFKKCLIEQSIDVLDKSVHQNVTEIIMNNQCSSDLEIKNCGEFGATCVTVFDAYYLLTFIYFGISVVWLIWIAKILYTLEKLPISDWRVYVNKIKLRIE